MKEPTIFYSDIKQILQDARNRAYSAVNHAMVESYWLIGKRIVEEEQSGKAKAEYGKKLIENLSVALTEEFGRGFSYANLWNFRRFYREFPKQEILYTLCRELSWSHLRVIMRLGHTEARNYYLSETILSQLQKGIR